MRTSRTPALPIGALLLVAAALPLTPTPAQAADTAAPAATAVGETYAAATADRSAAGCPPMRFSNIQRRVMDEADRGSDALRHYVHRTRMFYQLDLVETARWVDQIRQRNADCRTVITAMAP